MRYLFDTHAMLWYFEDSPKLSESVVSIIEDPAIQKCVSVASLWEFSIKYSMNKLKFEGGSTALWEMVLGNGFPVIPIGEPHLNGLIRLPFIHRDPFDRLLVATAKAESLCILTADENIHKYDVQSVW